MARFQDLNYKISRNLAYFTAILLIFAQLHEIKCARSALEQLDTLLVHTKKWMTFHLNATWDKGGLDLSNFQPGRLERILAKAGL